ncbi:recombination regulator RecX [Lysobacter sp. D1-1-M9]|uniref:recombination regulator RecX n=1 Tax=Novilysobacter longmucuonensis TaxID=3098603 RepID=UPI002FCAE417
MADGRSDDAGRSGPSSSRRRSRPALTPIQRALALLTRREHSRRELTRKLVARGLDPDEVETVVTKLASEGWQDDTRFAEGLVRWRTGSGYGPIHIRAELATHGLDDSAIGDALDTFEGDWVENARDLIRRRYGDAVADDLALRRKATDLLMRRGFDGGCIRAAIHSDPATE